MPSTTAVYERRFLTTDFAVRSAPGGHKVIEGYAAKFNRYSENLGGFVESIKAGSFKRAIDNPNIHGRYEHDLVLARSGAGTLRVSEDADGLPYEIDINMADPEAVAVLAKVERGDVNKSSFAFTVTRERDEWSETEEGFPLRSITNVARLFDVSIVSLPAYPDTDSKVRALRSFATAYDISPEVVEAAAESGDLIDLIRGARTLGVAPPVEERQTEDTKPPEQVAAVAAAVPVRLELERIAARRRARSRPR